MISRMQAYQDSRPGLWEYIVGMYKALRPFQDPFERLTKDN